MGILGLILLVGFALIVGLIAYIALAPLIHTWLFGAPTAAHGHYYVGGPGIGPIGLIRGLSS